MKNQPNIFAKYYNLFRVWSLDVVAGTLMVGLFFIRILHVEPTGWWWPILALAVWIIYTLDHLLDGMKGKNSQPVIYRHNYHFRHKKVLIITVGILSVVTLWAGISYLHWEIVKRGIFLFAIIVLYFLLVHLIQRKNHFFNQKELLIAGAYMAGILLAPAYWNKNPVTAQQIILIVVMTLLTWAEGILASWFDYENDLHDGHASFTTTFGKQHTGYFLVILHGLIFLLLIINVFFAENRLQLFAIVIESFMNLALLLLLLFPDVMQKNDRYRILGEMVFWLPGLIIFFG